ncbi:MAG: type II toxin-antitoxin system VapC family toxin [Desulfatirhabdiaceae bacterium]
MNDNIEAYVLDTSAWLTLIEDEKGADVVQKILEKSRDGEVVVIVSFITFMEVYYITLQEHGTAEAQERVELMASLPIRRIESSRALGILAAEIKALHKLSVADAWIAALAKEQHAILVHKDPEYEQIEDFIRTLRLPYKSLKCY